MRTTPHTFTPAHKQTNPEHAPGQQRMEITLADYIHNKTKPDALCAVTQEKKLTFDEWWDGERMCSSYRIAQEAWEAAQENM